MKSILVTGLCTLHWGRLQYGNIGNYYIVEPLFRQLHKHFPDYRIITTFQMDEQFIRKEDIEVVPMELYYSWNEEDVPNAYKDVEVAEKRAHNIECELTQWVECLLNCEYVINVSGDMWGNNAEHVGHKRFLVDCLKMKAAQLLQKKTILYAVTPGPFSDKEENQLAKEVFNKFDLVVIREKVSRDNLIKWGFSIEHVVWAPCPSFLFEANKDYRSKWTQCIGNSHEQQRKVIGITFGGFNLPCGPYDMWPRAEEQYEVYVKLAEYVMNDLKADLVIFSHTNGFDLPPHFRLKCGRDYMILEQLYHILLKKNPKYEEHIKLIDEPLLPCDIKKVIGNLDMLITGRVHASVAATSQCVPTVYVEYDRRVIYSDKMTGFSAQLGMEEFVCEPQNWNELREKVTECFQNLDNVKERLEEVIPVIKEEAQSAFEMIKEIK
jgi:colanic acid/amylovoran biosynthesis protein